MTLLNLQIINLLEEMFEELEGHNDCSSELSGGWQSAKYCNKLVNWQETINQIKVKLEK